MIILGIDPGLDTSGYAVLAREGRTLRVLETGLIRTGAPSTPLEARLLDLHTSLVQVIQEFRPHAVALEEVFSHAAFPRTAILMGHARGVIALVAGQSRTPLFSYDATRVKSQVTGNGQAGKAEVQRAVAARLSLAVPPVSDHIADALALALCHADSVAARSVGLATA
jgi:crossover junction endodeoxyribonuclease RuvC